MRNDFAKVVEIGMYKPAWTKKAMRVYCKIKYTDGNLSISGVEGPMISGNARGGAGQIVVQMDDAYIASVEPANGWSTENIRKFVEIWNKWHLNDLRAGCEHQRAEKWEDRRIDPSELPKSHANRDKKGILAIWVTPTEHNDGLLGVPCPICGYKYGTAWLREDVPNDVLEFLKSLPDSRTTPAWV